MAHTLIIDQGTHASRAIVFDTRGVLLMNVSRPVSLYRHSAHKIEQDAEEILQSIHQCLDEIRLQHGFEHIQHAALVTQRSTVVAWHKKTGRALAPALSWQDTRAESELEPFRLISTRVHEITGLPVSAHYGAGKMRWLLQHNTDVRHAAEQRQLVMAPLASYLLHHLSNHSYPVIDHSNAARTLLFDINRCQWSDALLNTLSINAECLPTCLPCLADYGVLINTNIPIKLVCGDQNAALYAEGKPANDVLTVNLGTGGFVLQTTGQRRVEHPRLLAGITSSRDNQVDYLLEGTVNGAGAALATLYDEIPEAELFEQLPGWLASIQSPPLFINSVGGLGSPWWCTDVTSRFIHEGAGDLPLAMRAVAIIESIVFLLQANIEQMTQQTTRGIHISGGLSALDGLCQKLADISNLPVSRRPQKEATACGAAWLLNPTKVRHENETDRVFTPQQNPVLLQRYQHFISTLTDAVHTTQR